MAYFSNVLLKINAKMGGLNSLLSIERFLSIPLIPKIPTIILGMDVSHGSPGHSDVPSIAAVASSRKWPLISRKAEMIASLFNLVSDAKETKDEGIVRDGVSDSQFNQVLNIEHNQIIEVCKFLEEKRSPKFTVIVAQKNHHKKFFLPGSSNNVPPGIVIDTKVCHPRNNDFYICSHAGMIVTRPTHYHVLYDEIGFSADDLPELVHSLSYVCTNSLCSLGCSSNRSFYEVRRHVRDFFKSWWDDFCWGCPSACTGETA